VIIGVFSAMRTTDGRTAKDEWNPRAQVLQISIAVLEMEWVGGASLGNTREPPLKPRKGLGWSLCPWYHADLNWVGKIEG
jgi:hypothetical protein